MKIIFLILSGLIVLLVIFSFFKAKKLQKIKYKESDKIKILTDGNFVSIVSKGIIIVDFWAEWCMPCKLMIAIMNELAEDPTINANIAKLNVETNQATAAKYAIRSIPTIIIFKNGKEINRFVGVKTADFLKKELKKL